jgi:hypothetical protein
LHRACDRGDTAPRRACALIQERSMKVTVVMDCTPEEARTFLGLPDVQPMQAAMMDQLQGKMMANIDKFSPESLIQSWFTFDPRMGEKFQEMFLNIASMGTMSKEKK